MRDAPGEFEGAQSAVIVANIIADSGELRPRSKTRQLFHDPPCHHLAIEKFGGFGKNALEQVLEKLLRKRKPDVGTNAVAFRDLLLEPAPHPVALDDDDF